MLNKGTITSSSLASTAGAFTFYLDDVANYAAYQSVFDQYRITRLEVAFIPRVSVLTSSSSNPGRICTVVDYDDATSLSSEAAALEYSNVLVSSGVDGHHRDFQPHCAVAVFGSAAFNAYGNEPSPWIDAASAHTAHYGVKWTWSITDANYVMDIYVRYWIDFRNIRGL